ncbi:fibronectin type III domain-containing protein [Flindersiella endophytica]
MTRFARVARRPVALWTAAALVLGTVIGLSAFGRGAPAVAFQQAGHWVYNATIGTVFRVDGGGKNVDSEVAGVQADPGSPVLQGSSNGYVVGPRQVTVFGKSDLSVKSTIKTGIDEEPLGIEAPGGPYLVYREHGQIVRLGDSQQTVTVGSVVSSAIATPDGTLWVRGADKFCQLAPGSTELECPLDAPARDAGALLTVGGEPAFANLAQRTVTQLAGDDAGRPVRMNVDGTLPATSVVAQADVGGRIPILTGDRLLLVDAAGTTPATTIRLAPRHYDALAATGAAVAVVDSERGELRTFDADGKAVQTHRLGKHKSGRGKADDHLRVTPGQDGRIYIDDVTGAVVTVIDGDGSVSEVATDGSNRPTSPDAKQAPTPDSTPTPTTTTPTPGPKPTTKQETPDPSRTDGPGRRWPLPTEDPDPDPEPKQTPKPPPAARPGAPGSVSATPDGWKATVNWTAARANGAPVTSYLVRFRVAPGNSVSGLPASGSRTVSGIRRSTTFTMFESGTFFCSPRCDYIFTVAATNRIGTGPAVDSKVVTVGGQSKPSAPTDVAAATKTDGSVDVSWKAPSTDYTLSGYNVSGSDGSNTSVPTYSTSTTLKPTLGKGVSYRVTAKNGAGTSPKSAATRTVYPYSQAAAPTVKATPGIGSVSLSWNTPNLNGGELVHYVVTATGQPDRKVTTNSTRYTGLSAVPLTFTVKAVTREKNRPSSATVDGQTGTASATPTGLLGGGLAPVPPALTVPATGVRRARPNRKDAQW